jgi:DNA-binding response OmpR family regulator
MLKTLLVEDEAAIRDMLGAVLETGGFEVVKANSAAEGTALLAEGGNFDVVITDLRMESPLAGFDVVRAAGKSVPRPAIVVLTAFPVPASDWRGAGADALFVKGTGVWALPEQVKALLRDRDHVDQRRK